MNCLIKTILLIIPVLLTMLSGCGDSKQLTEDFITVDVTTNYPKKELILQDFMDVEYIPLETNDDFLTQGFVQAIGKDILIVKNFRHDGDIFIFDRKTGKALRKINRKGQGGEEYIYISRMVLDEENDEMFVSDYTSKKLVVYDLFGNFKRSFKYKEGTGYDAIYNFDREHLICYDGFYSNDGVANLQSFMIISKQDGSVAKEIQIPLKKKVLTNVRVKDEAGITWGASPSNYFPIIPYLDNWIIVDSSSDTVYRYSPNHTMEPFLVRTPSVQSMNPEVFLFVGNLTDRYYFMKKVKKEYDFDIRSGFPSTNLMYDNQEKAIFEYTLHNDSYSTKKQGLMTWGPWSPVNNEIATWLHLEAFNLVNAYEKEQLKGKLKEIAATLDEESNPVIMLIKYKNEIIHE